MKFLFIIFLLFSCCLFSLSSFGLAERDKAFVNTVNILANPGFETGLGKWSKTGSSTLVKDTSTPLFGNVSAIWDASTTGEFLKSELVTANKGMNGQHCEALIDYSWTGTVGNIEFEVRDELDGTVATIVLPPTSSTNTNTAQLLFDCLDSATKQMRIVLESTANATPITIDKIYLGTATNISQVSQTTLVASIKYNSVSSCLPSRTNTAMGDIGTSAPCPAPTVIFESIPVNTTDDDKLNMVFDNLPAGTYKIQATTQVGIGAGSVQYGMRISDGTFVGNECGGRTGNSDTDTINQVTCDMTVTYTSSGPKEFRWQASSSSGTVQQRNDIPIYLSTQWTVWKVPSSSNEVINMKPKAEFWAARIGAATNTSLGTSSVSSYSPMVNSVADLVIEDGSQPVKISCANGTAPEGLTCNAAAVSENIGVAFDISSVGSYFACFSATVYVDNDSASANYQGAVQLHEVNVAGTTLQAPSSIVSVHMIALGLDNRRGMPTRSCGVFRFSTAGEKILKLKYEQDVGGVLDSVSLYDNRSGSIGQTDNHFTMIKISDGFPVPVFPEITDKAEHNNGSTPLIISSAKITNNGATCTFAKNYGLGGSVVRAGVGECTVTFASNLFSDTPSCTCSTNGAGLVAEICIANNVSSTGLSMFTRTNAGAGSDDSNTNLICVGPK